MTRHTKIISTIGPASCNRDTIRELVAAGTDVARLNFSHGSHDDHRLAAALVEEEAGSAGRQVALLQDLQGPRIRVGAVRGGEIELIRGERLVLTSDPAVESTADTVHISYDSLAKDVTKGGQILINDGMLELRVVDTDGTDVMAEVVVGGILQSRKGVNLPRIRPEGPALTEKDLADLAVGIELGVHFVALSFVRDESDVVRLRQQLRRAGHPASIIAKIEKPEAVDRIDQILAVSDGIMVARGDLGIEMPMAQVPGVQKSIIRKCRIAGKPVITATQMLESMVEHKRPTRAEASDVANAVLDGTDCVMLSGETAMGLHPGLVVNAMSRIVEEAERHQSRLPEGGRRLPEILAAIAEGQDLTQSVSLTACQLAEHVGAVAVACLTHSGATARSIARHRPRMPVYAFTDEPRLVGQLGLLWGTKGFHIRFQNDTDTGVGVVQETLLRSGLVRRGDYIVVTAGMPLRRRGLTNMVHVRQVA